MKLISLLLPGAALAGSILYLSARHRQIEDSRETVDRYRGTVAMVKTHQEKRRQPPANGTPNDGAAEEETDSGKSAAKVDLKELAAAFGAARLGQQMPDIKTMIKLQKVLIGLPPEEMSALIAEAGLLDIPVQEKSNLMSMLIQGLTEKDPKAGVLAASDYMEGASEEERRRMSWSLQSGFSNWAKKDLPAALTWYDQELAAGKFENTGLDDVNNRRVEFEKTVLQEVWKSNPDEARARLMELPEKERAAVLSRSGGLGEDAAARDEFITLVREVLPEGEQPEALKGLVRQSMGSGDLEKTGEMLQKLALAPAERNQLVAEAAQQMLQRQVWSQEEKPSVENTTKLRSWLAGQGHENPDALLGKTLAENVRDHGGSRFRPAEAVDLVKQLHQAQPSDELLTGFLETARQPSAKEAGLPLLDLIQDPAVREAARAKLAGSP